MRRILIISYSYWPSATPRAFRWTAIAELWAGQGHHIDVVCEASPGRPAYEVVNGVHVHRAGKVRVAARPTAPGLAGANMISRWKAGLRGALRRIWRGLYWPDFAFLWYKPALQVARILTKRHGYDAIFSSSVPFTSHWVAWPLTAVDKDVVWVVDIGDPFGFADGAPPNNLQLYGNRNRRAEGRIFARAQAITVTTEEAASRYAALFPHSKDKFHVIPPIYSSSSNKDAAPLFTNDGTIRLVYIGTLYSDIRSPKLLLECFSKLVVDHPEPRVELHFFGMVAGCEDDLAPHAGLVGTRLFFHGLVPQATAMRAMSEADVLVNIGNSTAYQLPSKVVEYLSVMKPILNLTNAEEDSSARFLGHYDATMTVCSAAITSDPTVFASFVDFVIKPPGLDVEQRQIALNRFSVAKVAEAYAELCITPN